MDLTTGRSATGPAAVFGTKDLGEVLRPLTAAGLRDAPGGPAAVSGRGASGVREFDTRRRLDRAGEQQLIRDAGAYKGTKVVFRGQVLQIQQDGDYGGIMLLSVTDEGYGFWTDNVWVDYDKPIDATEDDIITVYGTITGSKSYETQAGGETYVPQMRARCFG